MGRIGGHPAIRVRGTAEERARELGRRLAPQVDHLLRHYLGPFLGEAPGDGGPADRLAAGLREDERAAVRALAGGAGCDPRRMLLGNTFLDAHRTALCSTVFVRDRRTGEPLLGRNLDFPSFGVAHRLGIVLVHEPREGIPYVAIGWPGLLGVLSGLNRDGLATAVNLVYGESGAADGVPLTFALERALLRASTTAAAVEVLRATRFATTNNLTLCDAAGRAAVLEVGPDRFTVREPEGGTLHATNHLSCRRRPTLSPVSVSSHVRHLLLRRLAPRTTAEGSRAAVRRALRRVAIPRINLQSMIFEPARREIRLSMGRAPAARGRFSRLPAADLWGGSSRPGEEPIRNREWTVPWSVPDRPAV